MYTASTSVKTPEALQRSSHPDTPHSPAPLLKSVVASGRVQMEVISGTGRVSVVNPLLCGRGESGAGIKVSFLVLGTLVLLVLCMVRDIMIEDGHGMIYMEY